MAVRLPALRSAAKNFQCRLSFHLITPAVLIGIAVFMFSVSGCYSGITQPATQVKTQAPVPAGLSQKHWEDIQQKLAALAYEINGPDNQLWSRDKQRGLRYHFKKEGLAIGPDSDQADPKNWLILHTKAIGRNNQKQSIARSSWKKHGDFRVERQISGLTEWYENGAKGLEQGYTLAKKPKGKGEFWIEVELKGATVSAKGGNLQLNGSNGQFLNYGDLKAIDAKGHSLKSRFEIRDGQHLRLVMDDTNAVYPVLIDPTITGSETIVTVAGNGSQGYSGDSGSATAAALNRPAGIAVDALGDLYIADEFNNRIRKVSQGIISTVAGNGTQGYSGDGGLATAAAIYRPAGIAVDVKGDLYFADSVNSVIRKVSQGIISTVAGNGTFGFSGDGGAAISAAFDYPTDIAIDALGDMYVADQANNRIRKVSQGIISTVAGNGTKGYSGDGGAATSAALYYPVGIAIDALGDLYIADSSNGVIRKVSQGIISTVAGVAGQVGFFPPGDGDGGSPNAARLSYPTNIAVDTFGNLYISDTGWSVIRKVRQGIISTVAGNGIYGFSGDGGPATLATFSNSTNAIFIAVDALGDLYISDSGNNRIRKVSGLDIPLPPNDVFLYLSDTLSSATMSVSALQIPANSTLNLCSGDQLTTNNGIFVDVGGTLLISSGSVITGSLFNSGTIDILLNSPVCPTGGSGGGGGGGGGRIGGGHFINAGTVNIQDQFNVNSFTQTATGQMLFHIKGPTKVTEYSFLHATSAANLMGAFRVDLLNGYIPADGTTFDILQADGGISVAPPGSFDMFLPPGFTWSLVNNNTVMRLTYTAPFAPLSAANQSLATAVDAAISIDLTTGATGNPTSTAFVDTPGFGTVTGFPSTTIQYTPAKGFTGTDSFTFSLTDGTGVSNVATVTIKIASTAQIVYLDFGKGDGWFSSHGLPGKDIPPTKYSKPDANLSATEINEILNICNTVYGKYDVVFTKKPPSSGDYSTIYIGGTYQDVNYLVNAPTIGHAETIDIDNKNKSDSAIVLSGLPVFHPNNTNDLNLLSQVITHETGHILGLFHVFPDISLMYPVAGPSNFAISDNEQFAYINKAGSLVSSPYYLNSNGDLLCDIGAASNGLTDCTLADSYRQIVLKYASSLSVFNAKLVLTTVETDADSGAAEIDLGTLSTGNSTVTLNVPITLGQKAIILGSSVDGGPIDIIASDVNGFSGSLTDPASLELSLLSPSGKLLVQNLTFYKFTGTTISTYGTATLTDAGGVGVPIANAGTNQTIEATSANGASVKLDGTGSIDLAGNPLTITWTGPFGTANGATPTVTLPIGANTIALSADNGKGGVSTATVVITVVDQTPPVLTLPATIVIEATGSAGATVSYLVTASDAVDPSPKVSCTPVSGTVFALGTAPVSCTATDATGNASASSTFNVTVRDTVTPVVSNLPANIMAEATSANGAAVTYTQPTATDVVSGSVAVNCLPASGSTFPIATTEVSCTATDASGNTSTPSTFNITVQDTTPPAITNVPANMTAVATSANGSAVTYALPSATDVVSGAVPVTCTPVSGSTFPITTTTVSCLAKDAVGNAATASFTVTVTQPTTSNVAPVASNDSGETRMNVAKVINVAANDLDADNNLKNSQGGLLAGVNGMVVDNVTTVKGGSLSVCDGIACKPVGAVRYTPKISFRGDDKFTYKVKDALGALSNSATVKIDVSR